MSLVLNLGSQIASTNLGDPTKSQLQLNMAPRNVRARKSIDFDYESLLFPRR